MARTQLVVGAMLALAGGNANADPAQPCQVTIARAPDGVREVVEQWVKSEPQCSIALEVRIVPTEGGLYLLAEDEHGRVRERIVPDAQTAGVLVASWIADDNAPAEPPPPVAPPPPPPAAPAVVAPRESLTPPGLAPTSIAIAAPSGVRRSHWLTLGILLPMQNAAGSGLRAEVDAYRRSAWTLGVAASLAASRMNLYSSSGVGDIATRDTKGLAYLAYTAQLGRWQFRPELGAGVLYTDGTAWDGGTAFYRVAGWFPTAESSLMVSRELGKQWAIYGSPIATIISQRFTSAPLGGNSSLPMTIARGNIDIALFAGVRHRL